MPKILFPNVVYKIIAQNRSSIVATTNIFVIISLNENNIFKEIIKVIYVKKNIVISAK